VFWIVDNGSSHRGQASINRLEGRWHNLRLVHPGPRQSAGMSGSWFVMAFEEHRNERREALLMA
jgi:hypothetical protein